MNILLVYPKFLETFWNLRYLLEILSKKAAFPPLGLLTVAAMLPESWNKKLVDMNIHKLADKDIKWADVVLVGAMATQKDSTEEVLARCKKLGKKVILGGPILEIGCDEFPDADHLFLGETEDTIPGFLADLEAGKEKRIYLPEGFPDVSNSPVPLWSLINPNDYISAMIQYNRGCPYRCKFCSVAKLNGQKPRPKSPAQFLKELDAAYNAGFRGPVFIADDNFIGDKKRAKEMLPHIVMWQQGNGYPFNLTTEADITLADDPELMDLMAKAGFRQVFLGMETPNEESLVECGKLQNTGRNLLVCVKIIQSHGLVPMSGFIVGFDSDNPDTFAVQMIDFIQKSGIVVAMVGVLQAQPGTSLHEKLLKEGRLLEQASGNNTDCYPNFRTVMPVEKLVQGFREIVETIYSPEKHYERICNLLENYNPSNRPEKRINMSDLKTFVRASLHISLFGGPKVGYYYWKSLLSVIFSKKRRAFTDVVASHIYGAHFREFAASIQESQES